MDNKMLSYQYILILILRYLQLGLKQAAINQSESNNIVMNYIVLKVSSDYLFLS